MIKNRTKLLINISEDSKEAFQSLCRDHGRSMGDVIRSIIKAVNDKRIKIGGNGD